MCNINLIMKIAKKIVLSVVGLFLVIVIGLGIAIKIIVTKDFVATQIENQINGRVEISDISVPLWAVLSGVTIDGFKIGYKDAEMKKPMAERALMKKEVIGFKQFNFKIAAGKLITSFGKKIELNSLLIVEPVAHIVLYEKGGNNLTALLLKEKPASAEENSQPVKKEQNEKKEQSNNEKPFSVKSFSTVIRMGEIGIKNGSFTVNIQKFQNTLSLANMNLLLKDIVIDTQNLDKPELNRVNLIVGMLVKMDENKKAKGVQSFAIDFAADGRIAPFDAKTGYITEYMELNASLHKGTYFTGLAILEKFKKETDELKKVNIKMDFLKERMELGQDAKSAIIYNNGVVTFRDEPVLVTEDADVKVIKDSWLNIKTMKHEMSIDFNLNKRHTPVIESQVDKGVEPVLSAALKVLPSAVKTLVGDKLKTETVRNSILKPARNEESGQIMLSLLSKEDFASPVVKMTKPQFMSFKDAVQAGINEVKGSASGAINEQLDKAKAEADKAKAEAEAKAKAEADKAKVEAEAKAKAEADKQAEAAKKEAAKKGTDQLKKLKF